MTGPGADDRMIASQMKAELKRKVLEMKEDGLDVSQMDDILFMEEDEDLPASVNIDYLLKNWDVHYDYHIFSHRKILGPPLIFGRKIVNGEVNRAIMPLVSRQNQLNQVTAEVLKSHEASLRDMSERLLAVESDNESLSRRKAEEKPALSGQALVTERIMEVNERLDTLLAAMGIDSFSMTAFDEASGRSGDSVAEAFESLIGYFDGRKNVLDIGYGSGIFSDLAATRPFTLSSIDVRRADPVKHLSVLEDASLDGAFMGYVIESMGMANLPELVAALGKKMSPGAPLVIVTSDIPFRGDTAPDRIEAMLRAGGFYILESKRYQPEIPESARLQKALVDSPSRNARDALERLNAAIDKLNERLFEGHDLIMVARRSA